MIEVKKIPPLQCPQCQSTKVNKNAAGSIECEGCNTKTKKGGAKEKVAPANTVGHTQRKKLPEGYFE